MSTERLDTESPSFASDPELSRNDLGASALVDVASAYLPLFSSGELTAFLPEAPESDDEPAALAHRCAALHLAIASGASPAAETEIQAQG